MTTSVRGWASNMEYDKGVSPHIFALYREIIMRELGDMEDFRIVGAVVNNLRYADDTVIVAKSEEQVQRLINVVVAKSEEKGLHKNSAKSCSMVFLKSNITHTRHIDAQGNILEQVQSFLYLGKFVFLRCTM